MTNTITVQQVSIPMPLRWGGGEITGLLAPDGAFTPVKSFVAYMLGPEADDAPHRQRVGRDRILKRLARTMPVQTPGGVQSQLCLHFDGLGRFVDRMTPQQAREPLRGRIEEFQWDATKLLRGLFFQDPEVLALVRPVRTTLLPASKYRPIDAQAVSTELTVTPSPQTDAATINLAALIAQFQRSADPSDLPTAAEIAAQGTVSHEDLVRFCIFLVKRQNMLETRFYELARHPNIQALLHAASTASFGVPTSDSDDDEINADDEDE